MSTTRCDPTALGPAPEARASDRELRVSVLLPTVHAWPAVSAALESLRMQSDAPPFEVLVLDGHGNALPDAHDDATVRWIRLPGADSFVLRAAGIGHARGTIVAISEDHCVMPADWIASVVAAHRADPSPAIVGVVANHPASAVSAIDRANFIVTFAGQTPHRLSLRLGRLPVPTNLSFKRSSLAASPFTPTEFEYRWIAELLRDSQLGTAKSVVIHHRQSWGRATWAVHAASGRSYGATVHSAPFRARATWWLKFPLVPLRLMRLVLPELLHGAGGNRGGLADFVCAAGLIASNLSGQILGALHGPGASRLRL